MTQVGGETGPKDWNLLELQVNNAIDVGQVKPPDLNGQRLPLLKIFEYGRWQVKPEELELLKPSIQLASNLVRVGLPYIATFLPTRDEIFKGIDLFDENEDRAVLCPDVIPLKSNPSKGEVAATLDALENLAPSIRWQTNYEMWSGGTGIADRKLEWMGVTRLVDEKRPWDVISPEDIEGADAESMRNELGHRPLVIGIMGEYVNAIRKSSKTSERHLRATFMAAITMAHEIGHAIFHQDFRSYNPPTLEDPYVGKGCSRELGIAFITWIFNGFHPTANDLHDRSLVDFTAHLSWSEYYTVDIEARPLYKTLYSISMQYVEEKVTQTWWDTLPTATDLITFSSKAKEGLKPITDPDSSQVATAREPNWTYSWFTGSVRWKSEFDFRKQGYRSEDTVRGLSNKEIEWQKARQPLKGWEKHLAAKDPSELKSIQRRFGNIVKGAMVAEDDDEEFGIFEGGMADDDKDADTGGPDIDDGIVEKDVIPPLEDDTTPVTHIVVKYLPSEEASAKRPRYGHDVDAAGHDGRGAKRMKLGTQPIVRGSSAPDSDVAHAADKVVAEKNAADPENQPLAELEDFCHRNDLPAVGTKTSVVVRVKRFLEEQRRGLRTPRRSQEDRTSTSGFEVYKFKAILGQSTVAALKSSLFIQGDFPPEAVLTLYFRDDYNSPLQDHETLSKYTQKDWKTLRLKTARSSRFVLGSTPNNPIIVDTKPVVHFNDPTSLAGAGTAAAIEMPGFPVITIDDEATPAEVLKAAKADPIVQRAIAVVVHGASSRFGELLTSVGDRALTLDRAVTEGGKFADPSNPKPATSGLAIFEELEDYLEDERNRKRTLTALLDPVPRTPLERYPPIGSSHMADLFHATKRKESPPEDREEAEEESG